MRSRSTNILSQIIIFTFYNQQVDDVEDLDNNDDGDQTSNIFLLLRTSGQGGRTWLAFGGGKNGHETFRQARIYNFRDKCVVFARNLKFSNLTQ